MLLRGPLFLGGSLGDAKARVARVLADLGELELIELDGATEHEPAALFADRRPRVVVLPGGALEDRSLRLRLLSHGTLVQVGARGPAEQEAHAVVDASSADLRGVAESLLALAASTPVAVALKERTYCVEIASQNAAPRLADALARLAPTRTVVVTDDVVGPLVLPKLREAFGPNALVVTVPTGERNKTLATVEHILKVAIEAPVDRRSVVVGIGGGVVTDMAGFAAALALRGVRWIAVPTTLLAMVDASVGGKTGVDLGAAKNAVGAFHQPSRVIVDPSFTRTETLRAFRSGLAEVVKTALIGDTALYDEIRAPGGAERLVVDRDLDATTRAIRSSIAVKAGVVGRDEKEAGERAHLNLGHTIGHALETEGQFERLTHGEAVSLGLVAALRIGVRLGITPRGLANEVADVLARLGLPVALDAEPLHQALKWVGYDKKRSGNVVRSVMVRAPGSVEIVPLVPADLPALLAPLD